MMIKFDMNLAIRLRRDSVCRSAQPFQFLASTRGGRDIHLVWPVQSNADQGFRKNILFLGAHLHGVSFPAGMKTIGIQAQLRDGAPGCDSDAGDDSVQNVVIRVA